MKTTASRPGVRRVKRVEPSSRMAGYAARRRAGKETPCVNSFADFLEHHARVKSGPGYIPYNFAGREALRPIVARLDDILASGATDASLALCGGAQFGKTVLMLNLLAYLVAVRFRNVGYYLPDDDLVSGLVDGKLRPDVLDQIPWLARLIAVGKTLNASGRAVNRKGAFLCTDGTRTALAFMRGLGKIPTSFSMDVVVQDEKDDLPEEHARFLAGRMTASDLRLSLLIGTQRYHGAGQNLAFTEGTQHIGLLACTGCGAKVNPETAWPGVCRLVVEGRPTNDWPQLTREGHFSFAPELVSRAFGGPDNLLSGWTRSGGATGGHPKIAAPPVAGAPFLISRPIRDRTQISGDRLSARKDSSESRQQVVWTTTEEGTPAHREEASDQRATSTAASGATTNGWVAAPGQQGVRDTRGNIAFTPGQSYALCCPDCGALLDRANPQWHALAPEREALRRFSYRLSQLLIPAIDLAQIVAAWQLAIRDPAHMTVFCTDRLALPKSTTQTLTPAVLQAARGDYRLELPSASFPSCTWERTCRSSSAAHSDFTHYAGLDMGDQCWFVARAIDTKSPHLARLLWVEPIAAERVRTRVPELVRLLNIRALCVDAGPLRDLSRDLVFMLNGLDEDCVPSANDAAQNINFRGGSRTPCDGAFLQGGPDNSLSGWTRSSEATGGHRELSHQPATSCSLRESAQQVVRTTQQNGAPTLCWHGGTQKWRHIRAMAVEFTQREGQGLRHKLARTQEGRLYPLLAANRDETIERIVQELLPPQAGDPRLTELPDGTAATAPTQRFFLPRATDETRAVLDTYERHLLAGARQERTADGHGLRYLDKCENHFLLATAYAALAETLVTEIPAMALPAIRPLPMRRLTQNRSLAG